MATPTITTTSTEPPTATAPRRPGRLARFTRRAGIGLLVLALVGGLVEAALTARDTRRFPAPGDLLDAHATGVDLHTALQARGLDGPYLLVGHILGGLYVRVFAAAYPDEVVGLVLADPSHEDICAVDPDGMATLDSMQRLMRSVSVGAHVGLGRIVVPPLGSYFDGLPVQVQHAGHNPDQRWDDAHAAQRVLRTELADRSPHAQLHVLDQP